MQPFEHLRRLVDETLVASLAVLDADGPAASLVGFAALRDPLRFYLLVSDLASHTAALRADGRCGLLLHEPASPGDAQGNQALPRLVLRGRARFLTREEAEADGATAAWRSRSSVTEKLLGLRDFHFVEIVPITATLVLGFGRAFRASGPNLETLEHVSRT